jgi:signal transduction histidine kinase
MTRWIQALRGPMWRPLHVRAALVAVPLLLALGVTMFVMLRHYSAQTALEAGQRMNLGLAQYVIEHQTSTLILPSGEPDRERMAELAMHVMKINPAVEVYLLDRQGRVMAHALEGLNGVNPVGRQVDMRPLQQLLEQRRTGSLRLPILGVDPLNGQRADTFSAAAIRPPPGAADAQAGYLYIVLNGRAAQSVAADLNNSDALRAMAIGAAVASLLAAAVLVIAWQQLTRPLRQLTAELQTFRGDATTAPQLAAGDELGVLRHAVQALRSRVALQFQHLEDSDRQRRELVSNISHDLRTPLSNIQGYVETVLLREQQLDPVTRATHLRTALRHVDLLGKRIADLFELSKLDAGRVTPKTEVFCLAELLQDVVQNHQLESQRRGVTLKLSPTSHAQALVQADIAMIERVLQNLVDNALRYTDSGGAVTLALRPSGQFMEISISDTGRGIAQEHLPHIFERYWRATPAEESAAPGSSSGLGLAIVKRILDLHGSVVHVKSELQRGTRFEFLLPQAA